MFYWKFVHSAHVVHLGLSRLLHPEPHDDWDDLHFDSRMDPSEVIHVRLGSEESLESSRPSSVKLVCMSTMCCRLWRTSSWSSRSALMRSESEKLQSRVWSTWIIPCWRCARLKEVTAMEHYVSSRISDQHVNSNVHAIIFTKTVVFFGSPAAPRE